MAAIQRPFGCRMRYDDFIRYILHDFVFVIDGSMWYHPAGIHWSLKGFSFTAVGYFFLIAMPSLNLIVHVYTVFQKNGHPFCFCYNFVSRDQILVIFSSLVTKEICNRLLLTDFKNLPTHCVRSRTILGKCI